MGGAGTSLGWEEVLTVAPVEAETEATADSLSKEEAVIEIHHVVSISDCAVKLSEEVDVEADVFYPITCGDAKATLVKIMDSGELDFYQHTKVCSNTCRSTKIDLVGTKVSVSCDQSADLLSASASSADCKFHCLNYQLVYELISET
ncbi:hypothetical protein GOODEAATRI_026741 [Goodea atripinnis]|uniref:Uncharacterized protein n=1 Tax=Goodea atripinnis TaxID=208336 RepID=A0ABV0ML20_9TELE